MKLPNSTPVLVSLAREAHRAENSARSACGITGQWRRVTLVQALVFVKPVWCRTCYRGGPPL